jgi:hypothetical protein
MKLSDFNHGTIVRIGKNTYRLYRLEVFHNGVLGTMKSFARLQPCVKRGEHWWDDQNSKFEIHNWSDECELVDDSNVGVAGEKWDTRLKGVRDTISQGEI